MLVLHIDIVVLVPHEEHIAVRILRADRIAAPRVVEGQHHRLLANHAVLVACRRGADADAHVREAQQRVLDRLLEQLRAHRRVHLDRMARHARRIVLRRVQEYLLAAVGLQQRMYNKFFHR